MATQWETRPMTESAGGQAPTSRDSITTNGRTRGITSNPESLARGLGWFSIGLGVAELLAPRAVARIAGTRNHSGLIRAYGLREIAAGIGILTNAQPAGWVWSRVAGDMIDLASLGAALGSPDNDRGKTVFSIAAVAGVTALDVACAKQLTAQSSSASGMDTRLEANLIVNRSPEECYRFWRNFEQLPQFMSYLQSVRDMGDGRSHWVARAPGNMRLEWDAEIVNDTPNQAISWRSIEGSEVPNSGSVEFQPAAGNRGTIVRVQMDVGGPGALMSSLDRLVGKHPEQMIYKDLRRFKQVIETGEAITTEGQSAGRTSSTTWLDSIAR